MRFLPCPADLRGSLVWGGLVMGFVAMPAIAAIPAPVQPEPRTIELYSPSVDRHLKANILLPAEYEHSSDHYPVLYLLHGIQSHYGSWWSPEGVGAAASEAKLIVIMPDAGNFWYVNWPQDPERNPGKNRWEDFIVNDLIPHVDRRFRTIPRREGRAIAGHSMGGFGALMIGLRHPELFVTIGSTSGYLDYARAAAEELERPTQPRPLRRRQRSSEVRKSTDRYNLRPDPAIGTDGFSTRAQRSPEGRPFTTVEQARGHDPFTLVDGIPRDRLPHIYLDCGTEDSVYPFSRDLARKLLAERVPFDFNQSSGKHDDAYRNRAVRRLIAIQVDTMQRALGKLEAVAEPARLEVSP